jgi:hypothetical protein
VIGLQTTFAVVEQCELVLPDLRRIRVAPGSDSGGLRLAIDHDARSPDSWPSPPRPL